MSVPSLRVIRWGPERARSGPWRGDRSTAHLTPTSDSLPLSTGFVRHCTDQLRRAGFGSVVTSALSPAEQKAFLDEGWAVEQRLHLLAHQLRDLPAASPPVEVRMRRFRPHDQPVVLGVDGRAFDSFWTMDAKGLRDAVDATARARFRVAVSTGRVVGYAITGRSARRGYLQRLAVDTDRTGRGIGSALILDGLRWLERWGAERCLVNTQEDNDRALALYQRLGFVLQPGGLAVLGRRLSP